MWTDFLDSLIKGTRKSELSEQSVKAIETPNPAGLTSTVTTDASETVNRLLSEEGKARPIREVIIELYREHMSFLSRLPFVDVQGLNPDLYQRIQSAIEAMDSAAEAEDLGAFRLAKELVENLYMHAVALYCPTSVNIKVYSDVLGCFLWVVPTLQDMAGLQAEGVKDPVYTHDEIRKLKGTPPELLKAVNEAKGVFPGSLVKAAGRHSNQADVPVKPYKYNPSSKKEVKANG